MLTLKFHKAGKDSTRSDGKLVHSASLVVSDDNLLGEFLFRLPVRSLLRFKTMSRHWLSLITDPFFTSNYGLRNPPRVSGIFLYQSSHIRNAEYKFIPLDSTRSSVPFKSLTFIDDPFGICITHSCNGLLCCRSYRAEPIEREYYIYNPTTKQYTVLPRPSHSEEYQVYSLSIAFDPLESADYKIVCIRGTGMGVFNMYQLMIYSSSTPYWRTSGGVFSALDDVMGPGVYWNGALHWVGRHWHPSLCFNVNTEVFQYMPNAPVPGGHEGLMVEDYVNTEYVGASREHLYLVQRYDCSSQLNIFELESDYSRWNKKYHIDLIAMTLVYPEMLGYPGIAQDDHFQFNWDFYRFSVLHVQGEPGIPYLLLNIPNKIVSYNLKDETFVELQQLPPTHGLQYNCYDAFKYIETLSCV